MTLYTCLVAFTSPAQYVAIASSFQRAYRFSTEDPSVFSFGFGTFNSKHIVSSETLSIVLQARISIVSSTFISRGFFHRIFSAGGS